MGWLCCRRIKITVYRLQVTAKNVLKHSDILTLPS